MIEIKQYEIGQLVKIKVGKVEKGYATCGSTCRDDHYLIYEKIDLTSYPSYNDFFGKKVEVRNGDIASILSSLGPPLRIRSTKDKKRYHVYEILIKGMICQIFQKDLEASLKG